MDWFEKEVVGIRIDFLRVWVREGVGKRVRRKSRTWKRRDGVENAEMGGFILIFLNTLGL